MTSILVTGGAGFIGSHLVEELLAKGHRVRVLDNFSSGRRERLEPFSGEIEIVDGDLRSRQTVREAVHGVDFVLHQAAVPSVPQSVEDPVTTNDVNVGGTLHLLEAARDSGGQAPRQRLFLLGVRRQRNRAEDRRHGTGTDLPVRRFQVDGGVLLPGVLASVRFRNGVAQVFQRFRAGHGSPVPRTPPSSPSSRRD